MSEETKFLTATEYSELKGRHFSWGTRIAKIANQAGYSYVKKMGNYWVGTLEEWEMTLDKSGVQLQKNREKKD